MSLRQSIERLGRRAIVAILAVVLGSRRRPIQLGDRPTILVVRLDERVGNMLLLVPLLDSLRLRFPAARIHLLANARMRSLMDRHPTIDRFIPFDKRALLSAHGPLRAPFRLRAGHYDLAIDAANPTDPSTTQTILVRLSGARHTVGVARDAFAKLYSAPVQLDDPEAHEIDLRLQLLKPLPGDVVSRRVFLGDLPQPDAGVAALGAEMARAPTAILNVGARLPEKQLGAEVYTEIAMRLDAAGYAVLLTYGPAERPLAERVHEASGCRLAPETTLVDLAFLMHRARLVVTCDTGPMHVAVAVGTPTCGIFVSTLPSRYGHGPPHTIIDARNREPVDWLETISGLTPE